MIQIQAELRPELPTVYGPKDYHEFRNHLEEMDRILEISGAEQSLIMRLIATNKKKLSAKTSQGKYKIYRSALRYSILLVLTGLSHRKLARRVPDSILFQWFIGSARVDEVVSVGKSTIQRYEKLISSEEVSKLIHDLNRAISDEKEVTELLSCEAALKMDKVFADTTCVKTNIHFPVDWVLLRDATRTLIKAIILIRQHGLKHRIGNPKYFIREMNKLCIEMTHVRKTKDARKKRKAIFRRMKRLLKTIEVHGINYHRELQTHWGETDLSKHEAENVLSRMNNVLLQLPQAIKQAHERIIGERRVPNKEKILSLYESDTHVIVRGKAGAEIEFGNALYLAEQADGLIVDWQLLKEQPPADNKLVEASLKRIEQEYGQPKSYTGDRGFDSPGNRTQLEERDIINGICSRSVSKLTEQLEDEQFCLLQKRRAQTEGRIGIFKNAYLGKPLRSKGFENRQTRIVWCVLAHNLWKLARMAVHEKEKQRANAA